MNKVFTDGLSFALPLLMMALGALYCEKSGVTNLAIEGFQGVGAFFGALVATLLTPVLGSGNQMTIFIAILCAALGGALFSCIHGLLCLRFRANLVISGVGINNLRWTFPPGPPFRCFPIFRGSAGCFRICIPLRS